MTFQEIEINQKFYTSNGQPSVKISEGKAKSLVPICVSPCTNDYIEDDVFSLKPYARVYIE